MVAVALTAGACGSGGNQGSGTHGSVNGATSGSPAVAETSYQATKAAKTAKVSLQAQVSGAPAGTPAPNAISGDGVISFSPDAAQLAVKIPSGGTLTIRLLGQVLYLMVPPQAGKPATPKPWIKIDLDKAAQSSLGASFSSLSPSGSVNPADLLGYLQGVSTLKKVGTESIRGVPTTHYQGTVDLNKLAAKLTGQAQKSYRQLVSKLHTTTVPVGLWVDDRGRATQIRTTLPETTPPTTTTAPPTTAGHGATTAPTTAAPTTTAPARPATVTTTVDYYDFGSPVQVSAPPANQVTVIPQSAAAP